MILIISTSFGESLFIGSHVCIWVKIMLKQREKYTSEHSTRARELEGLHNLAARINGTTIGGVVGVDITYHGCNRKTPMVELVTINMHCREIARTLMRKKSLLLNK